jgi:hypothetical protein
VVHPRRTFTARRVFAQSFLLNRRNTSEQAFNREIEGADMVAELSFIEEWIPEQMEPGTLFVLESPGDLGEAQNPYWAVLACPSCGSLGLITRGQYAGLESMICGADSCSAEYFLREGEIGYRKPH